MNTAMKIKNVNKYNIEKELAAVKRLLKTIENDKSLPTFLDFFIECLVSENAENVNLKIMYPKIHRKLSTWLKEHNKKILAMGK